MNTLKENRCTICGIQKSGEHVGASSVQSSTTSRLARWLGAITTVAMLSTASALATSGSIFTSKGDGTVVNQNTYDAKSDVYLNGGPQNENASGLTDGTYYFQVTDPSDTTLLSTDPAVNRQLVVVNGRVAGSTAGGVVTPLGVPHANGSLNVANGSIPVQLIPFADTPNDGGTYKVWLIGPVESSSISISSTDPKVIVFDRNDAKTDNFKVLSSNGGGQPGGEGLTISGTKYYDLNATGFRDLGEGGVAGFHIEVTFALSNGGNVIRTAVTGADGSWSATIPDATELAALGQGVTLVGFTACEVQPAPNSDGSFWMQTGPLIGDETANPHVIMDNHQDYCWTGSLIGQTTSITGIDFGNICVLQPSGGFTLGYWSNKNGQNVLSGNDPAWRSLLTALNLRRAKGTDFDVLAQPTSFANAYKDFRTWILDATATNMAYMLSAQLAATVLNTQYKSLPASTLLYLPSETAMQPNLAVCYGANVVSIADVIGGANTELGLHPLTTSADAWRGKQECLKNILDNVNNNKLLFVLPAPGAVYYPE